MQTCDQCGSGVSDEYWRVFAVEGGLHGCLHCESKTGQHTPTETPASPNRSRDDARLSGNT